MMKQSLQQQAGFALIEVLVAILIFSFGILGLVGLQAVTINNSISAEDRSQAALLSDNLVAMLWSKSKLVGGSCDLLCAADGGNAKDYSNWQSKVAAVLQGGKGVAALDASNPALVKISITWTAAAKTAAATASRSYDTEVVVQ
ncbi:type IV pilus modification PilV family protein [Collimonas sp.]|jgi:type IV pilus assembly protein PilV|uniref:type IV pilus modification PilV family protein n=1 Tax=Collimonas sp. TaxID=1963772 RepID=UPI002CE86177|nr:prepilin-type N-terminal cleavage/methylation domain-containing protein [Collimonas sp.]HWW04711.1 prepilin-type N-terminal cleavage/methylation domain-containing protein [Collimonas sp.]